MQSTLNLAIPFDVLRMSLRELPLEQKRQLAEWLEEIISQAEEEAWEASTQFQNELNQARAAYEAGDFVSIDDYVVKQHKPA